MWEKVHSIRQLQTGAAFPINYQFTESLLLITASASNTRLTWHRAGMFYPMLMIPEVGIVQTKAIQLKLGSQLVQVFNPSNYRFTAEYETVDWFVDISLDFWTNTSLVSTDINAQVNNLTQLAIENRENIALVQQQLTNIDETLKTAYGQ